MRSSPTPAQFEAVHKQIEAKGIKADVAGVTELPTVTVPLADDQRGGGREQAD